MENYSFSHQILKSEYKIHNGIDITNNTFDYNNKLRIISYKLKSQADNNKISSGENGVLYLNEI